MSKLEKKYPLGSLVKYKTPFMKKFEFALVVGYRDYVTPNRVLGRWLKVLMSDRTIQDFDDTYCTVVSKFYSKYRGNNENRKRS